MAFHFDLRLTMSSHLTLGPFLPTALSSLNSGGYVHSLSKIYVRKYSLNLAQPGTLPSVRATEASTSSLLILTSCLLGMVSLPFAELR